jgi:hypothetical protein
MEDQAPQDFDGVKKDRQCFRASEDGIGSLETKEFGTFGFWRKQVGACGYNTGCPTQEGRAAHTRRLHTGGVEWGASRP